MSMVRAVNVPSIVLAPYAGRVNVNRPPVMMDFKTARKPMPTAVGRASTAASDSSVGWAVIVRAPFVRRTSVKRRPVMTDN